MKGNGLQVPGHRLSIFSVSFKVIFIERDISASHSRAAMGNDSLSFGNLLTSSASSVEINL